MDRGKRDTVETIKGDTHDVLDETKERMKSGAETVKDYDRGKRDLREGAERIEDGI